MRLYLSRARRTVAASFAWSFFGIGGQVVIRFVSLVVLARLISPQDFGSFAIASAVIGFIPMTAYAALRLCLVRSFRDADTLAGTTLVVGIVCGLFTTVVLLASCELLQRAIGTPHLAELLTGMACILAIDALAITPEALLLGKGRFRALASIELSSACIGGLVIPIGAAWLLNLGIWALALGAISYSLSRSLLLWVLFGEKVRPALKRSDLTELRRFSVGMAATQAANYVALQGDTYVVGHGLGASALGVYGRAYQLMAVPAMTFGGIVDRILYPMLCRARNHKRLLRREILAATRTLAEILIPMSACLVVIAPELITIILGPTWNSAIVPFQILALAIYFRSAYKIGDCVLRASGHLYNAAFRQWLYAVFVIVGATVGSTWGLGGVAMGVAIAIAMNWLSVMQHACRFAQINVFSMIAAHGPAALTAATATGLTILVASYTRSNGVNEYALASIGLLIPAALTTSLTLYRSLSSYAGPHRPAQHVGTKPSSQ
jgi:O-antigen/teichoic acid export membrane protein